MTWLLPLLALAAIPLIVGVVAYFESRQERRQQAREERRRELAGGESWLDGVDRPCIGRDPIPRGTTVDDPESSSWRRAA